MKRMSITCTLLCTIWLVLNPGQSTQAADPYFTFEESFALSPFPESGRFPIVTFIPRTMLLYIDDRDEMHPISGRNYLMAVTQDGVKVYIDETTVSTDTYKNVLGTQEIIFNSETTICKNIVCDSDDPDQVWNIHAGDAFYLRQASVSGVTELEGVRFRQKIIGYLNQSELKEMTMHGVITRADQTHPKYTITREISMDMSTQCGEIVTKGTTKELGGKIDIELPILKTFGIGIGLGAGAGKKVKIEKSYGAQNQKFSFFRYRIKNNRTGEQNQMLSQVIYECNQGPLISLSKRILRVDMINPKTKRIYSLPSGVFNTPADLYRYSGSAYLFSVNTYQQYSDLMERLGAIFEDRSLAGFFLSEFNRSCGSKYRRLDKVARYSYKEQ